MSNFEALITGRVDLSDAESKLNSFLKDRTLDIDVKFKNINSSSGTNSIAKQMQNAGKNASLAFTKGFSLSSPTIKEFTKTKQAIQKQVADTQKIIKNLNPTVDNKKVSAGTQKKWATEYVNNQLSAYKQAQKELGRATQRQNDVLKNINNLRYDSVLSTMNSKLNGFNGSSKGTDNFKNAESAIKSYESSLKSLKRHFDSTDSFSLDSKSFDKELQSMSNSADKFKSSLSMLKVETKNSLGSLDSSILGNKISKYMKDNTKLTKEYTDALSKLESRARSGENVNKEFSEIKSSAELSGLTGRSWTKELGRATQQIGVFAGVYGAIQNVAFEVPRQMVEAVKDINAAQIELTKVSTASSPQLNAYWDEAAESAKKYGSTINEVINSTADWSRLGYSLEDAKQLSDVTTLLTRVGDNMTQETSSEGLISTLKGFNMTADEALSIVDKVNEVANTQPIDTAGIFEGLSRSASSMSAANNSLEETIALITAANSVVQDADSVGTAFKTNKLSLCIEICIWYIFNCR